MRWALVVFLGAAALSCKKERVEPEEGPGEIASLAVSVTPVPSVPPVLPPPESLPVVTTVDTPASAAPTSSGKSSLEKASEAAKEGRSGEVRRLLEARVRAGHGSPEEARLVKAACAAPFDKACIDDVRAKYP